MDDAIARVAPDRPDAGLVDEIVAQFADGEISRHQAMHRLGVGYAELIQMVAERGRSLPRLSEAEAEAGARKVIELLNLAR